MKVILRGVEYGFSELTYNYTYVCTTRRKNAPNEHWIPGGRLAYFILKFFAKEHESIWYGDGYDQLNKMRADIYKALGV